MKQYPHILLLLALALSCAGPGKIQHIRREQLHARLALSRSEADEERKVIATSRRDTITVSGENGEQLLLMKAVKDEDSGEMVAHDIINAAVITARFRNVAERQGKVDLRFEIIVPTEMMDSRWQLSFFPDMYLLGDSIRLEPVIITGSDFRKGQLRGYEAYERYLRSIITDSTRFVDWRSLHIWIERNMPELYRYRNDSSYVDVEDLHSYFGPTQADAIRHYTNWYRRHYHEKRWRRRGEVFHALVKAPIHAEGIQLDTVLRDLDGDFVYQYTQSIRTRPQLRKVDIVLSGEITEKGERIYTMPRSEPLSFYISSLSTLADETPRYLTQIIERRASANTACYVDFAEGKADINLELGHNRSEMGRIRENIAALLQNQRYDLDSIVITASASPEGSVRANRDLSGRRAAAVADYYAAYIRRYRDSLRHSGFSILADADGVEHIRHEEPSALPLRSCSNGENWSLLTTLVRQDSLLSASEKDSYAWHLRIEDLDQREKALHAESYYRYLREQLYPRLRTVRFDFFLHRKGMVKDTVHTTVPDTLYQRGVQLLREHEYEKALGILKEYRDYNTALAYLSLDYNASALTILEQLPPSAAVHYMTALVHARREEDEKAVRNYLEACREDRSYVFRGNLDPEMYVLIQRYNLNEN